MDLINYIKIGILFKRIETKDEHFRASIIARNKDNNNKTRIIKRYTFGSADKLVSRWPEIIETCKKYNARFYLNPTVKSYRQIALDVIAKTADLIKQEDYEPIKNVYDSVADRNTGIKSKRLWIIDIDDLTKDKRDIITNLKKLYKDDWSLASNTKNGVHLMIKPQDVTKNELLKELSKNKIEYELKRNAMTPIYWPNKERREKKILLG